MNLFKICSFILFYFLSRVALSATCEDYSGLNRKEKLCFDDEIKGWVSEKCLGNKACQSTIFFSKKHKISKNVMSLGGQNPAALICHHLKLEVIILKDSENNEQSFCLFKDKSLADSNAIERNVE